MGNNITKYAELREYDDSKTDYETIKGIILYLDRIDNLIFTKMSEDNKTTLQTMDYMK